MIIQQQNYPERRRVIEPSSIDMKPCNICTMSDDRQDILALMRSNYSHLLQYSQVNAMKDESIVEYLIERLRLPGQLEQLAARRIELLRMAGVSCDYIQDICQYEDKKLSKLMESAIYKALEGKSVHSPYLQIVNEMCVKRLSNPLQCLEVIKRTPRLDVAQRNDKEDENWIKNIVYRFIHKLEQEWDSGMKQLGETVDLNNGISFRQRLETFIEFEMRMWEISVFKNLFFRIQQQSAKFMSERMKREELKRRQEARRVEQQNRRRVLEQQSFNQEQRYGYRQQNISVADERDIKRYQENSINPLTRNPQMTRMQAEEHLRQYPTNGAMNNQYTGAFFGMGTIGDRVVVQPTSNYPVTAYQIRAKEATTQPISNYSVNAYQQLPSSQQRSFHDPQKNKQELRSEFCQKMQAKREAERGNIRAEESERGGLRSSQSVVITASNQMSVRRQLLPQHNNLITISQESFGNSSVLSNSRTVPDHWTSASSMFTPPIINSSDSQEAYGRENAAQPPHAVQYQIPSNREAEHTYYHERPRIQIMPTASIRQQGIMKEQIPEAQSSNYNRLHDA